MQHLRAYRCAISHVRGLIQVRFFHLTQHIAHSRTQVYDVLLLKNLGQGLARCYTAFYSCRHIEIQICIVILPLHRARNIKWTQFLKVDYVSQSFLPIFGRNSARDLANAFIWSRRLRSDAPPGSLLPFVNVIALVKGLNRYFNISRSRSSLRQSNRFLCWSIQMLVSRPACMRATCQKSGPCQSSNDRICVMFSIRTCWFSCCMCRDIVAGSLMRDIVGRYRCSSKICTVWNYCKMH